MRTLTHAAVVALHESIAEAHNQIAGFYRFNWAEITGKFRSGIATPALLLESHSLDLAENSTKSAHFANRRISFLLLDFTGKADAYDKQEEVLDDLENIALDICAYLTKLSKESNSLLWQKFDANSVELEKVGPIFDNMYGWNVKYTLKNHEPMCFDAEKWNFPTP